MARSGASSGAEEPLPQPEPPVSREEFEKAIFSLLGITGELSLLIYSLFAFFDRKGIPMQEYWDSLDREALAKWRKMAKENADILYPDQHSGAAAKLYEWPKPAAPETD